MIIIKIELDPVFALAQPVLCAQVTLEHGKGSAAAQAGDGIIGKRLGNRNRWNGGFSRKLRCYLADFGLGGCGLEPGECGGKRLRQRQNVLHGCGFTASECGNHANCGLGNGGICKLCHFRMRLYYVGAG